MLCVFLSEVDSALLLSPLQAQRQNNGTSISLCKSVAEKATLRNNLNTE